MTEMAISIMMDAINLAEFLYPRNEANYRYLSIEELNGNYNMIDYYEALDEQYEVLDDMRHFSMSLIRCFPNIYKD